jgi:hypothetical protein
MHPFWVPPQTPSTPILDLFLTPIFKDSSVTPRSLQWLTGEKNNEKFVTARVDQSSAGAELSPDSCCFFVCESLPPSARI